MCKSMYLPVPIRVGGSCSDGLMIVNGDEFPSGDENEDKGEGKDEY